MSLNNYHSSKMKKKQLQNQGPQRLLKGIKKKPMLDSMSKKQKY